MVEFRLDRLPLDRRDPEDSPDKLYLRKEIAPRTDRQQRRRAGSSRVPVAPLSAALSSAGPGGYAVCQEAALASTFSGNFSEMLTIKPGSLAFPKDASSSRDQILAVWGDSQTPADAQVALIYRLAGLQHKLIARLTHTGAASPHEAVWTLASAPTPETVLHVWVQASGTTLKIYQATGNGTTITERASVAIPALTARDVTVGSDGLEELVLLGSGSRITRVASAGYSGFEEAPEGARPTICNLAIFNTALTTGQMATYAGTRLVGNEANLVLYLPLNDGDEDIKDLTGLKRLYLASGIPLQAAGEDGLFFDGEGGHVHVPFSPLFEQFYYSKSGSAVTRDFDLCLDWQAPARLAFRNTAGRIDAYLAQIPGLAEVYLVYTAGAWKLTGRIYHGDSSSVITGPSLAASTRYKISFGRSGNTAQLTVTSNAAAAATTAAVISEQGPDLDRADPPEVFFGIRQNRTAGEAAEHFEGRATGRLFHAALFPHGAPAGAHTQADDFDKIDPRSAVFFFDFSRTVGDYVPDLSSNGLNAFLEVADLDGVQQSPPFWTHGLIQDGDCVAAVAGFAFEPGAVVQPATDTPSRLASSHLSRAFSTDLTALRFGSRAVVVSNGRAHLVDNDARSARPLGVPAPTARPGVVTAGPGVLDGVCAVGYRWITKDGTKGPLKTLPPLQARFNNLRIGADAGGLGSSFVYCNNPTGVAGQRAYLNLPDAYVGGTGYTYFDDDHTLEVFSALDPDIERRDLREYVWDRGIAGPTSGTEFMAVFNGNGGLDPDTPLAVQVVLRFDTGPADTKLMELFSVGYPNEVIQTGAGASWKNTPLTVAIYKTGGVMHPAILWSKATTDSGTGLSTATGSAYNAGYTFTVGNVYNFLLVSDGDSLVKLHIQERTAAGVETWTMDVFSTTMTGFKANLSQPCLVSVGCRYVNGDPPVWFSAHPGGAQAVTPIALKQTSTLFFMRAWRRVLTEGEVRQTPYVWFDPEFEPGMENDLYHTVPFCTDNPADDKSRFVPGFRDSGQTKAYVIYKDKNFGDPKSGNALQDWDIGMERVAAIAVSPNAAWDSSPLFLTYTPLGNGSIVLLHDGEALWMTAAEPISQSTLTFDELRFDPQGMNCFTLYFDQTTTATAPKLGVREFWLNGKLRADVSGKYAARATGATAFEIGGWASGSNTMLATRISEVRAWIGRRYTEGDDFKWLSSRLPESEYSSLNAYYTLFEIEAGTPDYFTNYATGTPTALGLLLDANEKAYLVQNSVRGLPEPPSPNIVAIEVSRTALVKPEDRDDVEEIDDLKEIVQAMPYYRIGEAPVGVSSFLILGGDESLGVPVDRRSGYVPLKVDGVSSWQGQMVLLDTTRGLLWIAEPGPLGLESYPSHFAYEIPAVESGGPTAAIEFGDGQLVLGQSWGLMLHGDPSGPRPEPLGGGVGATDARAVTSYGGVAFAFNGTLWAIGAGAAPQDFGAPVQDLLPAAGAARLSVSAKLTSLLVFNEADGSVLRFHFPTGQWYYEARAARGLTDSGLNAFWACLSGRLAYEDAEVYADDVPYVVATPILTVTGGSSSAPTVSDVLPTTIAMEGFSVRYRDLEGLRIFYVPLSGTPETAEIASNASGTLILTSALGVTPAAGDSIYLGVDDIGAVLDTGPDRLGEERVSVSSVLARVDIGILNGAGWELATESKDTPGDVASLSGLSSYRAIASSGTDAPSGRGRFHRVRMRNRRPEAAGISFLAIQLLPVAQNSALQ